MGRKNAIKKSARGDLIPTPGPLEQQIEGAQFVKSRSGKREKRKRKVGNEAGEYIPNSLSERIISEARKQVCDIDLEDESGTVEESKRMRHVSLGVSNEETSDAESFTCDDGYDDQVIELDPKDEADLQRFMTNKEGVARTLYDIIKTKIDAKTDDAGFALSVADPMEFNMRDLDPEIVEMYKEIGKVLSKYRSGKIPKAFKVIPKMVNWEQILYLTDPDGWSAAAMYQATRLFASNLNPRMCQRFVCFDSLFFSFYNLVLLPRIRDDIDEFKKLNFHLYQALCKAVYKPAAFFKGIILPLCESGTCTLREATIFSSVLQKVSIPMFHAAAAMLKASSHIAELEYNGANSVFLRALIDKKFALPYKAIDAIVSHFLRMKNDERDMPVLWHQCLLAVCQRYKNDLSQEQKSAIVDLTRYHSHYLISPEIRRELESKEEESSHMVSKIEISEFQSHLDSCFLKLLDLCLHLWFCYLRLLNSFLLCKRSISIVISVVAVFTPTSNPTVIKRSVGTQLRYRPKIPSASDLVSAAPASVKPYLQLMRLDKPT
ncbi:Bystin, partial [Necator americanus]